MYTNTTSTRKLTSSSRINTRNLAQRRRNADNKQRHGDPTPDNVDGPATNERIRKRRGETVGDRREHKGHEGDLQRRPVPRELGLVAKVLECLVGLVG